MFELEYFTQFSTTAGGFACCKRDFEETGGHQEVCRSPGRIDQNKTSKYIIIFIYFYFYFFICMYAPQISCPVFELVYIVGNIVWIHDILDVCIWIRHSWNICIWIHHGCDVYTSIPS